MKKRTKKRLLQTIAIKCSWLLILFLGRVGRIRVINYHFFSNASQSGDPVIIIVWHGRMLLPIYIHRQQGIYAMVSEHADGEIIAQTILRIGYNTIRGSSTRGGSKAFRQMMRTLRQGNVCTILPDGPRGPRQVMKMGPVALAQRTHALLVPITFAATHPIKLKSWDRFTLWKPFTKIVALYGRPMKIPADARGEALETWRLHVEQEMNKLVKAADEMVRN